MVRKNERGALRRCPFCVLCRRPMISQTFKKEVHVPRWRCRECGCGCRKWSARGVTRVRRGEDLDRRPWCARCRRAMTTTGPGGFMCKGCQAHASAATRRYRPRRIIIARPDCPGCGHPQSSRITRGVQYFECQRCARGRRRLRENSEAATALLREIMIALPGYLTADEREAAAHSN